MATPTKFALEIRNRNFDLFKVVTKFQKGLSWNWDLVGGCGQCSLDLGREHDFLNGIGPDFDLQIWLEGFGLVYRGYLEMNRPVIQTPDTIKLSFVGYSGQLSRVRVNKTYNYQEISVIVKDILDTYVVPETKITYDETDIELTTFTPDVIEFDTMAPSALKTLADIAGNVEWGVDRNRKFFFKQKSREVRHRVRISKDVDKYDYIDDYAGITNRIHVKGGTVAGAKFEDTVNNEESQTAYGIRSRIASNSAIITSAVAQRWGSGLLASEARIQRRATILLVKNEAFFEQTVPVGRIVVIDPPIIQAKKYGDPDAIYGSFRYGQQPDYEISSIKYSLADEGTSVNINAGFARPNLTEEIKRLEYEIEQLRNA